MRLEWNRIKLFVIASIVCLGQSALAQQEVKLLTEASDSFPFAMKDKTGFNYILLDLVGKKLGIKITYTQVPWERCLATMKSGEGDGCFTGSFKEERREMGHYPWAGDKLDKTRYLHIGSYSIYVNPEQAATVKVSGLDITGIAKGKDDQKIGNVQGYSIGDDLKKAGYVVDSAAVSTAANFKKLNAKRLIAVAALTDEGDYWLTQPEFKGKVVKIDPPMLEKEYYLMLSKQFVEKNKDLSEKIWNTVKELRDSPEYKAECGKFLSSK